MADKLINNRLQAVTILGSTGSIGISTLNVIDQHPDRFKVQALTANTQVDRLFEQCQKYRPEIAVMVNESAAHELETKIKKAGLNIQVDVGVSGLEKVASLRDTDIVMAAIVGAAGLTPTLAAVKAGKRVLFANKEPLVMCGHIFLEEAKSSGATLLPIDSEHNAIFQCMPPDYRAGDQPPGIKRILLTGSGGPFRTTDQSMLEKVTPEQACSHPNWSMGKKISVDSATLMNKGLELIEACWLFNVAPDTVQIVIHPESIVHSMVEYLDGSVLAQLANPDMRIPIAHALSWPDRVTSGVDSLDFFRIGKLEFEKPDFERFPCLRLAHSVAKRGGTAPAILNAANEIAVQAFLDGEITYLNIARVIEHALTEVPCTDTTQLEAILKDDGIARRVSTDYIQSMSRSSHKNVG